jgi:hypothetical protein
MLPGETAKVYGSREACGVPGSDGAGTQNVVRRKNNTELGMFPTIHLEWC